MRQTCDPAGAVEPGLGARLALGEVDEGGVGEDGHRHQHQQQPQLLGSQASRTGQVRARQLVCQRCGSIYLIGLL